MDEKGLIYATANGRKKLEEELVELVAKRGDIAEQIKVAREFGDLKENSEYAVAREAQNNLEIRVDEIEEMLPHIKLFSYKNADTGVVNLGTCVTVQNVKTKKQESFVLTGILEVDADKNYISNESPKGKALLGKKVGETAIIKTPIMTTELKIVKIDKVKE
ncbi:MAG: transcription elongation factor GreA [Christensenellaceae bacterium]|jgi:transcription elongation factor GreA|nr:transcription elongation factor GreA [Christensenellaceae bacterium]